MAKVVASIPGSMPTSQYEKFMNGQVWEITMEDFPAARNIGALRGSIKSTAERKGFRVRSRIVGDKLYFQVFRPGQDPEANVSEAVEEAKAVSIID